MSSSGSFTIDIVRGDVVESRHLISAVIADRGGAVRWWGNRDRPTIPRSAIKSIQALPLVLTGALTDHDLSSEELALACASHSAEDAHVKAVLAWLDRIGLGEDDLECGPDRPLGQAVRRAWLAAGGAPRPVLNCCSGKHTGFLTVARQLDCPTAGYIEPHSPVQQRVTAAVATLTGLDLDGAGAGIDGCGIPVFAVPLWRLAFAMARMVDPVDLPDDYAEATVPIVGAAQLAFWVAGSGRTEMMVVDKAREPVVIKTGAEAVFMVGLPARGLGIALKVEDGTSRASAAAVVGLLRHLEVLPPAPEGAASPIRSKDGRVSGGIRVVIGTPDHPGGAGATH